MKFNSTILGVKQARLIINNLDKTIVITTKGEKQDQVRGLVRGANGYIVKPLNIREFRETILKFILYSG